MLAFWLPWLGLPETSRLTNTLFAVLFGFVLFFLTPCKTAVGVLSYRVLAISRSNSGRRLGPIGMAVWDENSVKASF